MRPVKWLWDLVWRGEVLGCLDTMGCKFDSSVKDKVWFSFLLESRCSFILVWLVTLCFALVTVHETCMTVRAKSYFSFKKIHNGFYMIQTRR